MTDDRPNVTQAVPFFAVKDMAASLRFYVDGLGGRIAMKWEPEGRIAWCWIVLGGAAVMLQRDRPDDHHPPPPPGPYGVGVTVCFMCRDAIAIYREAVARGLTPQEPFVGNRLWVTSFTDPDGYRLDFESPTDATEEVTLSEWEAREASAP